MTTIDQLTTLALRSTGDEAIAVRLVLSDLLEERGEPLGEMLRLACERCRKCGGKGRVHRYGSVFVRAGKPLRPRDSRSGEPQGRCGKCKGTGVRRLEKFAALRPVVLGPLIRAVDDALDRCDYCCGNGKTILPGSTPQAREPQIWVMTYLTHQTHKPRSIA